MYVVGLGRIVLAVCTVCTKLPDKLPLSYCWQTSFIIWSHLSPTGEHTCFAGTATVNRSPHPHSSRCWLEAPPDRPWRNWLQQLEEDTGLSVGAAWIARQDRSMWRTLRPSAGQRSSEWVSESSSARQIFPASGECFLTIPQPFLPHDAMHKRGLCHQTVSMSPSVCPSVCHVRKCYQTE